MYTLVHLTGIQTNTVVRSVPGHLHNVVINTTAAGAITIYDAAVAADAVTGNIIAVIAASAVGPNFEYQGDVKRGIIVTMAAASDITVSHGATSF